MLISRHEKIRRKCWITKCFSRKKDERKLLLPAFNFGDHNGSHGDLKDNMAIMETEMTIMNSMMGTMEI